MCCTERIRWHGRVTHVTRMSPWASHARASGMAWGGTGENVKVISTSSYHINSTCCWWTTASGPQGQGQSVTAGSDCHLPLGQAWICSTWHEWCRQETLVWAAASSASAGRSQVFHWFHETWSRSLLLLVTAFNFQFGAWQEMHHFCVACGEQVVRSRCVLGGTILNVLGKPAVRS